MTTEKAIRHAFEAPILEDVPEQRTQPKLSLVINKAPIKAPGAGCCHKCQQIEERNILGHTFL